MSRSNRSRWLAAVFAAGALAQAGVARAEPTRIDFGGYVTSVNAAAYPGVALGAPVSGFVVYESSASGQAVFASAPYGFSFDFAGTVVSNPTLIQYVGNDQCFGMTADCAVFGEYGKTLNFLDGSQSMLSNNSMPSPAVLQSFPTIGLSDNTGGTLKMYATIDRLSIAPVPEPEAYALALAGLGVIGWAARRRRG